MDAKGFSTRTGRLKNQGSTGPRGDEQSSGRCKVAALIITKILVLDSLNADGYRVPQTAQIDIDMMLVTSPPQYSTPRPLLIMN